MADPRTADVERILAEAPWVRRLARGLVAGPEAAEDLVQDVLVAALAERPDRQGLEGARLRAWLRTVARRLAGRGAAREAARRGVEARAARAETVRQAGELLDLHLRLAGALDRLPPTYRAALVLRYLQGFSFAEVAERLELTPAAARKRVSRGLALLREELDRDFGARDTWLAALAPLLVPMGALPTAHHPAPGSPRLPSIPEVTVMGLSLPKLALAGAALVGAAAWLARDGSSAAPHAPLPVSLPATLALAPPEDPVPSDVGPLAGPRAVGASRAEVAPEPGEAAPSEGPRLRVVDRGGQAIAGARAARIGTDGRVSALALDEGGSARMPEGSGGARFAAGAEGFAAGVAVAPAQGDLELVLEPERVLRGRLTEEGLPPAAPLWLTAWGDDDLELGVNASRVAMALREEGVLPIHRAAVDEAGVFALRGLRPAQALRMYLPQTHRLRAVDGHPMSGDAVRLSAQAEQVMVDTVRLPEVRARVVWDDDGRPVHDCSVTAFLPGRYSESSGAHSVSPGPDGVLRVGVPLPERALTGPPERRSEAIETRRVDLLVSAEGSETLLRQIDLEGARFPLDVGELRLVRKPLVVVRLRDAEGAPVAGAHVHAGGAPTGGGRTDASGEVRLTGKLGDPVQVLAAGFAFAAGEVPAPAPGASASELDLRLERGRTLVVQLGRLPSAVHAPLRLAWDEGPFEGFRRKDQGQLFARFAFHGVSPSDGSWNAPGFLPLPVSGERLEVPGLRAGARLRVELVDCLKQTLVELPVVVPEEPGTVECELGLEPGQAGQLEVELVDAGGTPLTAAKGSGRVFLGSTGSPSFAIEHGRFRSGALRPGTYEVRLQVNGYLPLRMEGVEVFEGAGPARAVLAPSRGLVVVARDASGRPLRGVARVRSAGGGPELGTALESGEWRFSDLPVEDLEVEVRVGTGAWTRPVPVGEERLELALPLHGELVASWETPPGVEGDAALGLEAVGSQGGPPAWVEEGFTHGVAERVELRLDLLPGDYELTWVLREDGDEGYGPWRELARSSVTVAAEGETHLTLE